MLHIYDQTDENSGTVVTEEMFGLNALISIHAGNDPILYDRYEDLGANSLRFPGGSITEQYFDISDVEGGSHDRSTGSFEGDLKELLPFTEFVELASRLDASITIVMPTMTGFTQSAGDALIADNYGNRTVRSEYLEDVADFIIMAMETADANGVEVDAIEIGNEYWGSGRMTASEYGELAAAMSQVIADTFADLGIAESAQPDIVVQTVSSAGIFSPSSDSIFYVDAATGFIYEPSELADLDDAFVDGLTEVTMASQGSSRDQALEIISAFEQTSIDVESPDGQVSQFDISGAANEIDGVVDHYYVAGGFDSVNTGEQYGFNQLELWNLELDSRDDSLPELEYYVTEWNTLKNGPIDDTNNRGLQQVSMNIEILYEMVTHNVTAAHFWPAIFNYSDSGTLITSSADALTITGEGFALMSESLVGLTPVLDFYIEDEISIHGYGDDDTLVFFLSERSGSENLMHLDFSDVVTLDAQYYQVSWTELWDGGAGGQDEAAQPVISETQVIELMTADEFEDFLLTMQPWSIVRLEAQAVDTSGASVSKSSNGQPSRYIEGSDHDDHLRGGLGDDTIIGGEGNDTITGGAGNDTVEGGSGNDQIWAGSDDVGNDRLLGGSGNDTLAGGAGDDTLFGGDGEDVLFGGSGNDDLFGEAGSDVIWAGTGNDLIYGGTENDTLGGGQGADTIFAGAGDDVVYGSTEADIVHGEAGNDTLFGGSGNDTIFGGAGDDEMYSGAGTDVFVFEAGHGNDSIGGFETNGDNMIDVSALGLSGFSDLSLSQEADGVVVQTGEGSITLWGAVLAGITADDFIF